MLSTCSGLARARGVRLDSFHVVVYDVAVPLPIPAHNSAGIVHPGGVYIRGIVVSTVHLPDGSFGACAWGYVLGRQSVLLV